MKKIIVLVILMYSYTEINAQTFNEQPIKDKTENGEYKFIGFNNTAKSKRGCHLYGKIKIVEYGEDYKIKFVEYGEDLKIKYVSYGEDEVGKWKIVEYGEDYKVKIVDYGETYKIKDVDYGQGCD